MKTLTLSIPTRNRSAYLAELLSTIRLQVADREVAERVQVFIFDNASEDNTREVVEGCGFPLHYQRNAENIGPDSNIFQAYTAVVGDYVLVIGDDELLPDGALRRLLIILDKHAPHLVINRLPEQGELNTEIYADFQDYARKLSDTFPYHFVNQTLISMNIIRRDLFDAETAKARYATYYGHMYGIISGLLKHPGPVVLPSEETLIIREVRATPVDDFWSDTIDQDLINYLLWLKATCDLQHFDPAGLILSGYRAHVLAKRGHVVGSLYYLFKRLCLTVPVLSPAIYAGKHLLKRIGVLSRW